MPIDYIYFLLIKKIKKYGKETSLTERQLYDSIIPILTDYSLPEFVRDLALGIGYPLSRDLVKYKKYILIEKSNIILREDVTTDDIDNLLKEISSNYDQRVIANIDNFYDFNINVLETIGIEIDKELYNEGMKLEEEIAGSYYLLAIYETNRKKDLNSKKVSELQQFKNDKNNFFSKIREKLSSEEYYYLYRYSRYLLHFHNMYELSHYIFDEFLCNVHNDELIQYIEENLILRALFLKKLSYETKLIFSESFYLENKINDEYNILFYKEVVKKIESIADKQENYEDRCQLICAKYRLMYVTEMLYKGNEQLKEEKENTINNDYFSFLESKIFSFIDEILGYSDAMIASDYFDNKYYCNIYLSLISAYYNMTKDQKITDYIKSHTNYGKCHFVTELLDNIVEKNKSKTKTKE